MAVGRLVVAPGQVIGSDWGNHTNEQSVNRFASAADRTSQWPTPHDGAVSYLEDTDLFYGYSKGAWQVLGPAAATLLTANGTAGTVPTGQTYNPLGGSTGLALTRGGRPFLAVCTYFAELNMPANSEARVDLLINGTILRQSRHGAGSASRWDNFEITDTYVSAAGVTLQLTVGVTSTAGTVSYAADARFHRLIASIYPY
jgi:hypothetical protein